MKTSTASLLLTSLALVPAAARAADEGPDPRITKMLEAVSEERLGTTIRTLAGFETRHTLSATDSPTRGIGAARQWLLDEMHRSCPRLQVSFDVHQIAKRPPRVPRDIELSNVMAVLPGRSPRRVYVSGHYDSVARRRRSEQGMQTAGAEGDFDWGTGSRPAPGANDDGSGTAIALELARVMCESGLEFDATLVFIAFAGEEEGLLGAAAHARRVAEEGVRIDAVLNSDIVGNVTSGNGITDSTSVRVFSEGPEDSPSRALARFIARQAALYVPGHGVRLISRHDRFGRGGDHTPFNQHGFAAVRFTEARENYTRQHTVDDTPDGVSIPYLARNTRVVGAAAAVLALAPPAPVVQEAGRLLPQLDRSPSGYDAHLRWAAVPGAAGYVVFWRDAWSADWQHERRVGAVTELVLPGTLIDDHVFAVAAVGPGGHESLATTYVYQVRARTEETTTP
jgi:hypothetical protein